MALLRISTPKFSWGWTFEINKLNKCGRQRRWLSHCVCPSRLLIGQIELMNNVVWATLNRINKRTSGSRVLICVMYCNKWATCSWVTWQIIEHNDIPPDDCWNVNCFGCQRPQEIFFFFFITFCNISKCSCKIMTMFLIFF